MPSNFPAGYDSFSTHHDNSAERVAAGHINSIQDAVVALQHGIGLNPASTYVSRQSGGTSATAASLPVVNVKDFGAMGNGIVDDTTAIQTALTTAAGGVVYFPPGIYGITSPLTVPEYSTLVGAYGGLLYPNFTTDWQTVVPSWGLRASTIQYLSGHHGAIFSNGSLCTFEGLVLRYGGSSTSADVVFGSTPGQFRFINNVVQALYSVRVDIGASWGAALIFGNQFTGMSTVFGGCLLDCRIIGNTFTSIGGNSIYLSTGAGPNIITGNRFEWGAGAAIYFYTGSRNNQVVGNIFDAHAGPGVSIVQVSDENIISGNLFWRNSRNMPGDYTDCHIYMQASSGQVIEANTFRLGGPDLGSSGSLSPKYVVSADSMRGGKNTFIGNNVRNGCTSSRIFVDPYGTSAACFEMLSADIPTGRNPNTTSDDLASGLGELSRLVINPIPAYLYENRYATSNVNVPNLILRGAASSAITITDSSGSLNQLAGIESGINYNSKSYKAATRQADVQVFTASGTWTKPSGAVSVRVDMMAAGAGGGSGCLGAAGTVRCGGGAGGGGGWSSTTIPASACGSTESVTVGTGGTGGAAVSASSTNGNGGSAGGNSQFGSGSSGKCRATGGSGGGGGTSSAGTAGAAGSGISAGAPGAAASGTGAAGAAGNASIAGAPGGGSGGGITSADAASNGGAGASATIWGQGSSSPSGGTAPGGNGGTATNIAANVVGCLASGAGGASSTSGNGGSGGSGGLYGAAGGGGAAAVNGSSSGKGGDGASGIVVVTTYF